MPHLDSALACYTEEKQGRIYATSASIYLPQPDRQEQTSWWPVEKCTTRRNKTPPPNNQILLPTGLMQD
jgi:hypothetical protein